MRFSSNWKCHYNVKCRKLNPHNFFHSFFPAWTDVPCQPLKKYMDHNTGSPWSLRSGVGLSISWRQGQEQDRKTFTLNKICVFWSVEQRGFIKPRTLGKTPYSCAVDSVNVKKPCYGRIWKKGLKQAVGHMGLWIPVARSQKSFDVHFKEQPENRGRSQASDMLQNM